MMTPEKIAEACEFMDRALVDYLPGLTILPLPGDTSKPVSPGHLRWMLHKIPTFVAEGRREKAMRWLGFVQGVFASQNILTIDQLKQANAPDDRTS